jgi:hypothetical protein
MLDIGSDLQRQISLPCLCYLRCALIPHCDPSCTNFRLTFILVAIENLGIKISTAALVGELSFRLAFPRAKFNLESTSDNSKAYSHDMPATWRHR